MSGPRVYIAGPISGPDVIAILGNIRRGLQLSHKVLRAGFQPFSPFTDFLFSLMGEVSIEEYYEYSMSWLRVSDCVLLVEGWESSKGTLKEIEEAESLGIPVFLRVQDLEKWAAYVREEQRLIKEVDAINQKLNK